MANRLLQTLAADYCCVQRFLEENVIGRDLEEAAEDLGVTVRTITNYRRRYRIYAVYACPRCDYNRRKREEDAPPIELGKVVHQYPGAKSRRGS